MEPANAQCFKIGKDAEAEAFEIKADADARAAQLQLEGDAMAEADKMIGEAEAGAMSRKVRRGRRHVSNPPRDRHCGCGTLLSPLLFVATALLLRL